MGNSPDPAKLSPGLPWCPAARSWRAPARASRAAHKHGSGRGFPGQGPRVLRIAHSYIRRCLCRRSNPCPFVPPLEEWDVPCQRAVLWRDDTLSWGPRARSRQLPVLLPCQAEPWQMWGTSAFSFCSRFSVKSLLEKCA